MLASLNLGCGPDDWGDIRVDFDFATQTGVPSKLNLRADAHALPFRDKAFASCRCWHVLEHVDDPKQVVREIRRVSRSADIRCPVDEGYWMQIMIGMINLQWPVFINAYRTARHRYHRWIIRPPKGSYVSDRYIVYPRMFVSGRKARLLRRFARRYYYEWTLMI